MIAGTKTYYVLKVAGQYIRAFYENMTVHGYSYGWEYLLTPKREEALKFDTPQEAHAWTMKPWSKTVRPLTVENVIAVCEVPEDLQWPTI